MTHKQWSSLNAVSRTVDERIANRTGVAMTPQDAQDYFGTLQAAAMGRIEDLTPVAVGPRYRIINGDSTRPQADAWRSVYDPHPTRLSPSLQRIAREGASSRDIACLLSAAEWGESETRAQAAPPQAGTPSVLHAYLIDDIGRTELPF